MFDRLLILCVALPLTWSAAAATLVGDSLVRRITSASIACMETSGKEGDIIAGVESRLRFDAPAGTLVLAAGVNDLAAREPVLALSDYDHLLRTLPRDRRVIVSAVLPVGESRHVDTTMLRARIAVFNAGLKALAARYGVEYLDASTALAGPDGKLRPEFSLDGVHLTPAGTGAWVSALPDVCK